MAEGEGEEGHRLVNSISPMDSLSQTRASAAAGVVVEEVVEEVEEEEEEVVVVEVVVQRAAAVVQTTRWDQSTVNVQTGVEEVEVAAAAAAVVQEHPKHLR